MTPERESELRARAVWYQSVGMVDEADLIAEVLADLAAAREREGMLREAVAHAMWRTHWYLTDGCDECRNVEAGLAIAAPASKPSSRFRAICAAREAQRIATTPLKPEEGR